MTAETTTTTTTDSELEFNKYRFAGFRYQLQAPSTCGPNDIIPQITSLYPFPAGDEEET